MMTARNFILNGIDVEFRSLDLKADYFEFHAKKGIFLADHI